LTHDKVTIQEASVILSIGRKTIYRWIDKGLLSKTKEGKNAYVSLAEVRTLYDRSDTQTDTQNVSGNVTDTQQGTQLDTQDTHRGTNTAIVDVAYLEGLLVRLGQLEAEKRYLLEYKGGLEEKDKELAETKATLAKANSELRRVINYKSEAEAKAKELQAREKEVEELRAELERTRMPWYKRLFLKK